MFRKTTEQKVQNHMLRSLISDWVMIISPAAGALPHSRPQSSACMVIITIGSSSCSNNSSSGTKR
jgi:hypothetical protein